MPSEQETSPSFTRRHLLAGGAAAAALAVAGCDSQPSPPQQPHRTDMPMPNAALKSLRDFSNLSNLRFIDSDGKPVNLNALQSSIGTRWSTMSFMYAACGDTCPMTGAALGTVSRSHPDLRHIIVSVDPLGDFRNRRLHDLMKLQGLTVDGPNRNTFILYPTTDGTTADRSLLEGGATAVEIQHKLELVTHGGDPLGHNATVTLFDPQGQARAQVLEGPATIVQTLQQNLPKNGAAR